ncbi:Alpha-amylase, partial [Frankliniella fusca]
VWKCIASHWFHPRFQNKFLNFGQFWLKSGIYFFRFYTVHTCVPYTIGRGFRRRSRFWCRNQFLIRFWAKHP